MNRRAYGFTLIEVLIVVVVGTILTSMAVKGFGTVLGQTSTRQARNVFVGLVARARAQAIESGQTMAVVTSATGDSVSIVAQGTVLETVRFGTEMDVDIQAASDVTQLCMNAKGYADTGCNSFSSAVTMAFVQGTEADSVEILPMGQVRW